MEKADSFDKPFKEVPGGRYDSNGFYINPDRSFYDPDKVYFNSKGYDRHGGFYDSNLEYQPGEGWIPELMCYEDEKEAVLHNQTNGNNNEEEDDNDDILDQIYVNDKNFDNVVGELNVENIFKPGFNEEKLFQKSSDNKKDNPSLPSNPSISSNTVTVNEQIITPDMLFNKIPDDKIPPSAKQEHISSDCIENKNNFPITDHKIISEEKLEIDSLFS